MARNRLADTNRSCNPLCCTHHRRLSSCRTMLLGSVRSDTHALKKLVSRYTRAITPLFYPVSAGKATLSPPNGLARVRDVLGGFLWCRRLACTAAGTA